MSVQVGTTDADPSGSEQEDHPVDKRLEDAHGVRNENTNSPTGSTIADADDESVAPLPRLRARASTFVSTSSDGISTRNIVPTWSSALSGGLVTATTASKLNDDQQAFGGLFTVVSEDNISILSITDFLDGTIEGWNT